MQEKSAQTPPSQDQPVRETPSAVETPTSKTPPTGETKNIAQMAGGFLDQLPPLPENWKALFIKWYPWLLILGGILGGIGVLAALGLFSFATAVTLGGILAPGVLGKNFIWLIFGGAEALLSLLGGFGMKNMKKSGWNYAMMAEGIGIVSSLGNGGVLGIIVSLLFIYFLWQVKGLYK